MGNQWFGWVVGVDPEETEIKWGDVLMLSRWTGRCWFTRPLRDLGVGVGASVQAAYGDSTGQKFIRSGGRDKLAFLAKADILMRLASWEAATSPNPSVGMAYPVGPRVLVRHDPLVRTVGKGVLRADWKREWNLQGQVLAVGAEVTDVEVGRRCLVAPNSGFHFDWGDRSCSLIREEDVEATWEEDKADSCV